jgi:uncharacterized protein YxjI
MRIDINQKILAIGNQYKIYINKKETYYAETELFTFLPIVNLYPIENLNPKLTMIKMLSWFKPKYKIRFPDESKIEFKSESYLKSFYRCKHNSDLYEIYGHVNRKYSVFKNNVQIASWDKDAVTFLEGDNYVLFINNNTNHELIISFCLIIDIIKRKSKSGNLITIDLGNIWEIKKYNPDWKPT